MKTLKTVPFGGRKVAVATPADREQPKEEEEEQMIETRAWKKIRGLIVEDMCRLCGEQRETVQHLLSLDAKSWQEQNILEDMITL